ncbi:hypothetical protein PRIPAC_89885 [Pristionchus pacificus]|uniref:Uncharacterized protein n=1 Tax=Pristionchus pacificus TaxID=54126 RepID=A0A2A6CTP1_PRIPA|nr:hypothetical protein PRIPAC_89885 [Pristionchus pacificus]|eukprot:PDM81403.1 hypothetical protein PRIPAC_35279 [Pristionchus pacificus]
MRLFLLILHFCLVLVSRQHESELSAELKDGFPVGEMAASVTVDLFEDFSKANSPRLQFELHDDLKHNRKMFSHVHINNTKLTEMFRIWIPEGEKTLWWRFDLYKINASRYLPFLNGFDAINRTMVGVDNVTSVHISSYKKDKPNFPEVYVMLDMMGFIREPALLLIKQCFHCVMILNKLQINLRLPSKAPGGSITPYPEDVIAAMGAAAVESNKDKVTEFWELDNFSIGKKIKLSVLMQSAPADKLYKEWNLNMDKFYSTLVFVNKEKTWGFGICNKYKDHDDFPNKPEKKYDGKVQLQLFSDPHISNFDISYWPQGLYWEGSGMGAKAVCDRIEQIQLGLAQ